MVSTDLPLPGRGPVPPETGDVPSGDPIRLVVDVGGRYQLSVYSFGLACCAVEFVAAGYGGHAGFEHPGRLGQRPGDPPAVEVLVVSGTLTDKMAPAIRRFYDRMPEPRYVVAFGACASCGGPYWDSYSVTKGVDQLVPVDVYVPGCPPRPEALVHGLRVLHEQIESGSRAAAEVSG